MKGKLIALSVVWLVVLGVGALTWKLMVKPAQEEAQQQAVEEEKNKILTETGADSRYDHHLTLALDGFSGYAVLRSQEFSNELARKKIKLTLSDDGADYSARIKALQDGEVQMAVFTVDSLIKSSAELGELPGTIVCVIDETRGADAMVAYKSAIPNLDALNANDVEFVLTPNSPSETLARVVMAHFGLDNLKVDPFVKVNDAAEVYRRYRTADPEKPQVFVLWQPYVTKVLENPNTHVVVDSSRFKGYIVDVLVVNRDFLYKNKETVKEFVESYLTAAYKYQDNFVKLVSDDAKGSGTPLTETQADDLVGGIWWKNTQENYSHFGVHSNDRSLQHIEDIIENITKVLVDTKAIIRDPTNGKPNLLYYTDILEEMAQGNFHPGFEKIRDDKTVLPALTENQWESLQPVGTLQVPPIAFRRGTSDIEENSRAVLDDLVAKLETWPQYYVVVRGNASLRGDLDANKKLAEQRAEAAKSYLIGRGVHVNRIRSVAVDPNGRSSVDFVLGQTPY